MGSHGRVGVGRRAVLLFLLFVLFVVFVLFVFVLFVVRGVEVVGLGGLGGVEMVVEVRMMVVDCVVSERGSQYRWGTELQVELEYPETAPVTKLVSRAYPSPLDFSKT